VAAERAKTDSRREAVGKGDFALLKEFGFSERAQVVAALLS